MWSAVQQMYLLQACVHIYVCILVIRGKMMLFADTVAFGQLAASYSSNVPNGQQRLLIKNSGSSDTHNRTHITKTFVFIRQAMSPKEDTQINADTNTHPLSLSRSLLLSYCYCDKVYLSSKSARGKIKT